MRVYRIETQDGTGMYMCSFQYDIPSHLRDFLQNEWHPVPHEEYDEYGYPYNSHHDMYASWRKAFGFASIKQLDEWVNHEELPYHLDTWTDKFNPLGLSASEYEVEDEYCVVTPTQCFFDRSHATLICRHTVRELLEIGGL